MSVKCRSEIFHHISLDVNVARELSIFHTLNSLADLAENSESVASKSELGALDIRPLETKILNKLEINQ